MLFCSTAETRDRTGDLQIFSLTLSQLSYRGTGFIPNPFNANCCLGHPHCDERALKHHPDHPRFCLRNRPHVYILPPLKYATDKLKKRVRGLRTNCERKLLSPDMCCHSTTGQTTIPTAECGILLLKLHTSHRHQPQAKILWGTFMPKFRHRDSNPGCSGEGRVS